MSLFDRGLSAVFLAELRTGPSAVILETCRAADLDVRLRDDYLNAYAGGRSVARIGWRRGRALLEIHGKYLRPDAFDGLGRSDAAYACLPVTPRLAAQFVDELPEIRRAASAFARVEELSEDRLLRDNAGGGPVTCVDRQVGIPGTRSYVDVVGVLDGAPPALVLVEIKRDLDKRIQDVPAQVARYVGFFAPEGRGLRPDVAASLRTVASQLADLGFAAPAPRVFEAGMPVHGLVVLVRYNPRSRLLGRAHDVARTLPVPIWLWVAEDDQRLRLPAHDGWTRMGAV